jgi:hypothetical protein
MPILDYYTTNNIHFNTLGIKNVAETPSRRHGTAQHSIDRAAEASVHSSF